MKVDITSGTRVVEETVVLKKTVPVVIGTVTVYPVQFRNYDEGVHIQHAGEKVNRDYGFAFTTAGGQVEEDNPVLPSLAGTGKLYNYGALVISGQGVILVAPHKREYHLPMSSIPSALLT